MTTRGGEDARISGFQARLDLVEDGRLDDRRDGDLDDFVLGFGSSGLGFAPD